MVPFCPKNIFGLVEARVHAALAMPATLAAVGAIFQDLPALCPCTPVSRAERCKPCLVALVPTLGCSRPLPPSLLLLAPALSGIIMPGYVFLFK